MKPTPEQKEILNFVRQRGEATKAEICKISDRYFCNGSKHVGERLSRMVKSGMLIRVKNGVYRLGDGVKKSVVAISDKKQIELFK